jgi:hypothetical protein
MSISRSKSRQFNWKSKRKKRKEKTFFHSFFLPKKGGVGCRLRVSFFFFGRNAKNKPQTGEEEQKEVLGPFSSKKKKKQLRVPSKKNSTTRA